MKIDANLSSVGKLIDALVCSSITGGIMIAGNAHQTQFQTVIKQPANAEILKLFSMLLIINAFPVLALVLPISNKLNAYAPMGLFMINLEIVFQLSRFARTISNLILAKNPVIASLAIIEIEKNAKNVIKVALGVLGLPTNNVLNAQMFL